VVPPSLIRQNLIHFFSDNAQDKRLALANNSEDRFQ